MLKQITKKLLPLTLLTTLLFSCATTKQDQVNIDEYDSSVTSENENTENDDENTTETNENGSPVKFTATKQKKNFWKDFITYGNKEDFVTGDVTSVFTKAVTGSISQKKSTIFINPENGTAGFGTSYMAAFYIVQFDEKARSKFAAAYKSYLEDFENKKLVRKSSKTKKAYGSMDVHLDWGSIKSSTPNNGNGTAFLGYEFVKKSPYFVLYIPTLKNDHYDDVGDSTTRESITLKYYFTKAQAAELVEYLKDENILKFLETYSSDSYPKPATTDDYEE